MRNDEDPGGVVFLDFISNHYHEMKSKLQKLYKSFVFSEDVFHDTIIKMHKIFETKKCAPEIFIKYMCSAFKTNMLRERSFFRNAKTDTMTDFGCNEPYEHGYTETFIDVSLMEDHLRKKFGNTLTNAYMDWLSGYEIKEIMETHNINSGYYHIKKMTKYIIDIYVNSHMTSK